ncbi:MAG: IS66 family insertion sequence element accessory protein TnpA [Lachnospiraceae bacterium]
MARAMFTDNELFQLITECRSSGLSDFQWCREHGIKNSTFYAWIARLKKKGTSVPESSRHQHPASLKNDVVKVDIVPDTYPVHENTMEQNTPLSQSMSASCNPTIEILSGNLCIRFTNEVHPELLGIILTSLGGNAYGR